MDILAHALWTGAAVVVVHRRRPVPPAVAGAAVAMGVLPDLVHMLPLLAWVLAGEGSFQALMAYATALPGAGPALPPWVALWSHHLHCTLHSAVVAAAVTLLLALAARGQPWPGLWLPLLAWWGHIGIDVPTHSADFYPVSVLYPLTMRGFDGLAWNTPWFMALNYAALAATAGWLWHTRSSWRRP